MAFLQFPIYFAEDTFEAKENLGLPVEQNEGIMTINTQCICGYNESDDGDIMCRMANGDCWRLPLKRKDFESILFRSEMLITITALKEN
jgi:hypothetical protein